MPDFLPRQRWPLASCQTGTDDLPTRFGPNVRRWGTGGSQTHPNVTVTALGGASAGRRFFADRADNVMPAD
jgi:hypothetical protein